MLGYIWLGTSTHWPGYFVGRVVFEMNYGLGGGIGFVVANMDEVVFDTGRGVVGVDLVVVV